MESLEGITDFAKFLKIPCVGGKVSFYNETPSGPIKPTPLIGVLGIVNKTPLHQTSPKSGDYLLIVGSTKNELGGSEYFEYIDNFIGGICPTVDFKSSKLNMSTVLSLIKQNLVKSVHDCAKGGLAIAVSEMSIFGEIGCNIDIGKLPSQKNLNLEQLLFSESHSRYLLVVTQKNIKKVKQILLKEKNTFGVLGNFTSDQISIKHKSKNLVKVNVDTAQRKYFNALKEILDNG